MLVLSEIIMYLTKTCKHNSKPCPMNSECPIKPRTCSEVTQEDWLNAITQDIKRLLYKE